MSRIDCRQCEHIRKGDRLNWYCDKGVTLIVYHSVPWSPLSVCDFRKDFEMPDIPVSV